VAAKARDLESGWTWVRVPRPLLGRGRKIRVFASLASRRLGHYGASVVFGDVPGGSVYLPHGGVWRAWRRQEIASAESEKEARRITRAITRSPRQQAARSLELATLQHGRLAGVIALSRIVATELKALGCPRPVSVIPNGISLPPPSPRARWHKEPVLLFAAHNFRLKGLAPFLRILAAAGGKGLVAGKGDPRPYRALVRSLGLASKVRFLGPKVSLEPLFSEADLLVQPSFYDPCSLTTLEALARGVGVVTSGFNGAGELIGEGAGAVVADPQDTEGFAGAVRGLLQRDRGEVAAAARASAASVAEPGQSLKAVLQIEAWHRIR
jgi:UDP-glucose:(heptosyl)LPS alpha-1,3-glucosyltransferase